MKISSKFSDKEIGRVMARGLLKQPEERVWS
jgi:hypothetical protein